MLCVEANSLSKSYGNFNWFVGTEMTVLVIGAVIFFGIATKLLSKLEL